MSEIWVVRRGTPKKGATYLTAYGAWLPLCYAARFDTALLAVNWSRTRFNVIAKVKGLQPKGSRVKTGMGVWANAAYSDKDTFAVKLRQSA